MGGACVVDLDVAKVNQVEGELDSFVLRRDAQRRRDEGERAPEEIWQESVRAFNAQRQEALAWQWLEYHQRRQRAHRNTFALLDAHHAAEIAKYERLLGLDEPRLAHELNGKEKRHERTGETAPGGSVALQPGAGGRSGGAPRLGGQSMG